MSYEGYSQLLCKNGHYWKKDCYELDYMDKKDYPRCPVCGEKHVWENMVDVTNGSFDDDGTRIDGYIELKRRSETSGICSACGEIHVCETTYFIPKEEETR